VTRSVGAVMRMRPRPLTPMKRPGDALLLVVLVAAILWMGWEVDLLWAAVASVSVALVQGAFVTVRRHRGSTSNRDQFDA
jgi:hypothetical protein